MKNPEPAASSMNIRNVLAKKYSQKEFRFSDAILNPAKIRAIMINEVVPQNPEDDFYGSAADPDYLKTTVPLFQKAGADVETINDILNMGVYITNAVKIPKTAYAVEQTVIDRCIPILEDELALFSDLQVIMLMGDVAKKMFNKIAKSQTGKNVIPSGSTYKLRSSEFYYGQIRVFPSYIMTGGNILIEKSKFEMASGDIRRMLQIVSAK